MSQTLRYGQSLRAGLSTAVIFALVLGSLGLGLGLARPTTVVLAKPKPFLGAVLTVGALLGVGKLVNDAIDHAKDAAVGASKEILENAQREIQELIRFIEEKFQDNLDIALDKADAFVDGQLSRLFNLVQQINDQILDDIAVISDTALNIIDQASKEINTTIDHAADKLKEVIIVATESGAALIDRSADRLWQLIFGIVGLVALIVVGIGFFSMRSASTLGKFQIIGLVLLGIVFLIGLSGVTVPPVRTFILSRTAAQAADKKLVALTQPYISFVFPKKLVASTDAQMRILGGKLPTQGNPPVVKIGGTVVNIATRNDREIVVDVPATVFTTVGIASVTVKFDTMADEMGTSVEFTAPRADLTVSAITFSPTSPRTGQRVTISVTVQNQGQGVAPEFEVAWQPKASLNVQPLTQVITNLEAGQSKVITFSFTYTDSGAMQTTASVNQDRKTRETNTANNRLSVTLQVQPPAPTKTPTRTPRPTRDPDNPLPPICDTKPNLPQCQPKP